MTTHAGKIKVSVNILRIMSFSVRLKSSPKDCLFQVTFLKLPIWVQLPIFGNGFFLIFEKCLFSVDSIFGIFFAFLPILGILLEKQNRNKHDHCWLTSLL